MAGQFQRSRSAIVWLCGLVLAGGLLTPGVSVVGQDSSACVPHPPIVVTEDEGPEGFVLVNETPVYRPGSGVTSGSGTAQDPYVIEGWCLVPSDFEESGVLLQDTSAHVVIRDNLIVGPPTEYTIGITLDGATNVQVEANTIQQGGGDGMKLRSAHGSTVKENTISDVRIGVFQWTSKEPRFEGNVFEDARIGIYTIDPEDIVVEGNTFENAEEKGLLLSGALRGTIRGNSILHGGDDAMGILVTDKSEDVSVLGNEIRENGDGVRVVDSTGTVVQDNNFVKNDKFGVKAVLGSVDARFNWWGCALGPGNPQCDDVSGSVVYSPWRTAQSSFAGS